MFKTRMDGRGTQSCILLYIKYPEPGRVKTRLSEALDGGVAAELYRHFVIDVLAMVKDTGHDVIICYAPAGREEDFRRWLGPRHRYHRQRGDTLGEKLKHGFADIYAAGYRSAVAIGSDSPDLPSRYIEMAFTRLGEHDVVIGPAVDGGYYLIGFARDTFVPEAFDGIEWSTSTVLHETLRNLRRQPGDVDVHLLPAWKDVDTLDDLWALIYRTRNSAFASSATMRYITDQIP